MANNATVSELLMLTSEIVASHVSNNAVGSDELPSLIRQIYEALNGLAVPKGPAAAPRPEPAVPIRKSVNDDHIVCLEDGKKLKMLKRYLKSRYDMMPEQYRERWGLPADYPMVAPAFAARRSALAKQIGLGTKPRKRRRG
jgi:predicted transcriptional regulator